MRSIARPQPVRRGLARHDGTSDTAALVWALNTRLIAGATATDTLLAWCDEHGLSAGPITVEIRQHFAPAVVPDEVLPALELDPGDTIHYRQVRLMRGSLPLAAAENWFVPQRLTADMNETLIETTVPFGSVIAPLFHYRNHGADYGRVLAGIQVPAAERAQLKRSLDELGYPYWDESDNPAYRSFLNRVTGRI